MARFSRVDVINAILRSGLVPVFYHPDVEVAKKVIEACAAGGAQVFEFTNRGDNAYRVFSELGEYFRVALPSLTLGVGSVLDPVTGGMYISSGANFVVGSVLNPELARICNRRKVSYSPGCGSASEISQAEELGVEIVKIFPGDSVGGPGFVKAVLGPSPWTRIMPTGGVEASRESIAAWFKAGVAAVGMGTNLVQKDWVTAGNYERIAEQTRQVLAWIRQSRGESLFQGIEHVGLYEGPGTSAASAAAWYQEVFGFDCHEGHSSIMVHEPRQGSLELVKQAGTGRCHIAIRVSEFDAAVADLQARGFAMEEPIVKPDSKAAYLQASDPLGNRVHLIWRR